ncbi:MAG: RIP metalloprotease RseP [Zetaproteobacteria bacterium]|nr:RIP metalloprotease RseP [Zetaproteobacteria bacterium]
MESLHTLLSFVVAIAILVAVHEFGHFIVAIKLGIKVEKFSIGFGPALFSWRGKNSGVEYIIAAIPLGGYVKMLGENLDDQGEGKTQALSPEELARAFHVQPVWKRAAVAVAGPMFNFAFAIVAYMCVAWLGQQVMPPVVGHVAANSVSERAGIQPNDRLLTLNGQPLHAWSQFEEALKSQVGHDIILDVERNGHDFSVTLPVQAGQKDALLVSVSEDALGLTLGTQVLVDSVVKGSPAAAAGLKAGDEFIQVEGQDLDGVRHLIREIQSHAGQVLSLLVLRDGVTLGLQITPKAENEHGVGKAGVHLVSKPLTEAIIYQQGVWEGVVYGFERTYEMTVLTVQVMGKMLTAAISPENLGGPIAIAQLAGRTADLGLVAFITFLALISVNLGVLNLLPVPILDGGHLVYLGLEKLRGKPLSDVVMERTQMVGVLLIGLLMVFAFYNDLMRLFRG